jgi:hypothetical protein
MALEAITFDGNKSEIPNTSKLKKTTLIIISLTYFIYSHLNILKAMAYTTIIQISKNEISGQTEIKLAPSNEILRMALLKCVKGNNLQKGCIQVGKLSIEKNVPANKN